MNDVLEAREERVGIQNALQMEYKKPLLVNRVNMPGKDKNTSLANRIFEKIELVLTEQLKNKVLDQRMLNFSEGPIMIRVVNMNAEILKKFAIAIENGNRLGRFVDLDVYSLEGEILSRKKFGYESRKCYVCQKPAHECVRSQTHTLEELLNHMEEEVNNSN